MHKRAVASILAYGGTSLALILFNKVILSSYEFKYPCLMTMTHMLASLCGTSLLKASGYTSYPDLNIDTAIKVIPLSTAFACNVVLGLTALRVVQVPIFTTLRRLTTLFILAIDAIFLNIYPSPIVSLSVSLMMLGALLAGCGDLSFDLVSYLYVFANNASSALFLIFMKQMDDNPLNDLNAFGKTFYNASLSLPVLFSLSLVTGELESILEFKYLYDPTFQLLLAFSGLLAFLMNWATFWCTSQTDALTTSITGQIKNMALTMLGLFFASSPPTPELVGGIATAICGGLLYMYATQIAPRKSGEGKTSQNEMVETTSSPVEETTERERLIETA